MGEDFYRRKAEHMLDLAVEESINQEYDALCAQMEAENSPHIFSEDHQKKMKGLLKKAQRQGCKRYLKKHGGQVAAVAALTLALSVFAVSKVEAVRLPVCNFFLEIQEKYAVLRIGEEHNRYATEKFTQQEASYIPRGFHVKKVLEEKDQYIITYVDDEDGWFSLRYIRGLREAGKDEEAVETTMTEIGGYKAVIMEKEDEMRITMYREMDQFELEGNLSWQESIKILESIE